MLLFEIVAFYRKSKWNIHRLLLTLSCTMSCILSLVWLFDPFSFSLRRNFPSLGLSFVWFGLAIVTFLLLLKIWIKSTNTAVVYKEVRIFLIFVHVIAGLVLIVSCVQAAVPQYIEYIPNGSWIYIAFILLGIVVALIGFLFYGHNMYNTLNKKYHADSKGVRVARKSIICSIFYAIFIIAGIIIYEIKLLGGIFSVLIMHVCLGAGFFVVFLLLFFKMQSRRGRSQSIRMVVH